VVEDGWSFLLPHTEQDATVYYTVVDKRGENGIIMYVKYTRNRK